MALTSLVIVGSSVLGAIRIFGHRGNVFKDTAHLWTGWLVGLWSIRGGSVEWWAFWVLCIVEVTCFAWFYFNPAVDPNPDSSWP